MRWLTADDYFFLAHPLELSPHSLPQDISAAVFSYITVVFSKKIFLVAKIITVIDCFKRFEKKKDSVSSLVLNCVHTFSIFFNVEHRTFFYKHI